MTSEWPRCFEIDESWNATKSESGNSKTESAAKYCNFGCAMEEHIQVLFKYYCNWYYYYFILFSYLIYCHSPYFGLVLLALNMSHSVSFVCTCCTSLLRDSLRLSFITALAFLPRAFSVPYTFRYFDVYLLLYDWTIIHTRWRICKDNQQIIFTQT